MTNARPSGSGAIPPEIDYRLDRLLEDWWEYEKNYHGGPAHAHASSVYARSKSRSGYDSAEEMLSESVDRVVMEAIGSSVTSLDREHREAIEMRMLNTLTASVWRSNRLGDRVDALYAEAKVLLLPMLRRRRVEI